MKKILFPITALFLVLLLAGCIRTDYIGQEFPSRRHGAVLFFPRQDKVPPGEYLVMGRLQLKAPNGTDGFDIQDKLVAEATDRGADAVVLVSSKAVEVGYMPNRVGETAPAMLQRNPANVSLSGRPMLTDSFGKPVRFGGNYQVRTEIQVKSLLLIRKEAFEAIRQDHPEEAEPLFMKEDPSGQPIRFPSVSADLPSKPAAAPAAEMPDDHTVFSENKAVFPEAQADSL